MDLEARVRADHPLRVIVNEALAVLEREFAAIGRPVYPAGEAARDWGCCCAGSISLGRKDLLIHASGGPYISRIVNQLLTRNRLEPISLFARRHLRREVREVYLVESSVGGQRRWAASR